ncbi:CBU_0592 family membrane protein [Luteimicrobium subarcticum]|uniref:CBU-0592-like domain-containing protein n=1 Tax=Luteimicrobium subarcticum TaxID=620910 RepID=A0A2M8WR91_9MICO|nr:hypothetical protein [Luteimicrobium subarcticum]PJI93424.1 hypothetical protein CLV34_1997 [Luteimicrobium subarcticum]
MYDVVQIVGSLLILSAFVGSLLGRIDASGYRYLVVNAVGSAILTVTAIISREWGFIMLEGVWAVVSVYTIVRKARGGGRPGEPQPQGA